MTKPRVIAELDARPRGAEIPRVPASLVDAVLDMLKPLAEAVAQTIGPHCEVVLHDLRIPERSIVAIWNGGITGRRVGDPVIGGPSKDVALKLLGSGITESTLSVGYKTRTKDGRDLRSTSLVLRMPDGKPAIAFCVNVDLSAITMARFLLEELSRTVSSDSNSPSEDARTLDVAKVITEMIDETLQEVGKPSKFMDREERLRAVQLMHERGLFLIKGGVERAAAALGISRFTLYSYLKEVRSRHPDTQKYSIGRGGEP